MIQLTDKDIEILVNMEDLSHNLIDKYITKEYNEDGEIINPEHELWIDYWNLVEKIITTKGGKK